MLLIFIVRLVCTVFVSNNNILVIDKSKGPYKNRYDLPGGSLYEEESLLAALHRECKEETGLEVKVIKQVGTVDFQYLSKFKDYTHVHHIAVLYEVEKSAGKS